MENEDETLTVGSRAHTSVTVASPNPNPDADKPPGAHEPLWSCTLNGANHAGAKGGVGFTHNVPAEKFRAWLKHAEQYLPELFAQVFEVKEGTPEAAAAEKPSAMSLTAAETGPEQRPNQLANPEMPTLPAAPSAAVVEEDKPGE